MRLNVDITTLILTIALGHFFSAILSLSYALQRQRDTAIHFFLGARLFDTLGWIFLGLQAFVYDVRWVVLGNCFLILAQTAQILSLLKVKKRYTRWVGKAYGIASAVCVALFWLSTVAFHANAGTRIALMSGMMAVLWAYPVYFLLSEKKVSFLQRAVAYVYGAEIILLVLRTYVSLRYNASMSLLSSNVYNALFFVGLYLVMLMGNIGFILMAKESTDVELMKAAQYDELTEIFNRREFLLRAKEMIIWHERKEEPLSFLMIDLDHFKKINDAYGHNAGDLVLKEFSQILKRNLRPNDLFGRIGGEEFAVLLSRTGVEAALTIADRLRALAEKTAVILQRNHAIQYTISIGTITVTPDASTSVDTLYKASDAALYVAKTNGRNRIEASGTLTLEG